MAPADGIEWEAALNCVPVTRGMSAVLGANIAQGMEPWQLNDGGESGGESDRSEDRQEKGGEEAPKQYLPVGKIRVATVLCVPILRRKDRMRRKRGSGR